MNFPQRDEARGPYDDPQGGPDADQELVEEEGQSAEQIADKLHVFSGRLSTRRDQWIAARAVQGHDLRWREDLDQYNGQDAGTRSNRSELMTVVQQGGMPVTSQKRTAARSTVFVQVTRQKTNSMHARWSDIVCPNDERNFGILNTPVPGLPAFVQLGGAPTAGAPSQPAAPDASAAGAAPMGAPPIGGPQPAAQGGPAPQAPAGPPQGGTAPQAPELDEKQRRQLEESTEAGKRAQAMQQEIQDCFDECDKTAEDRKVLFDAALFGAGVLKGPVVVNRTRKAWAKRIDMTGAATWVMDKVTEIKPASFRIDPRYFWPDPQCGEYVQNGSGCFELDKKTGKQVRELAKQPGYIRTQLLKVIEEGPTANRSTVIGSAEEDRDRVGGDLYEHWIYWGEVDRDDLEAAGCACPEDDLEVVSACIEMINSTVVRAYLNPIADGALPYDVVPCERIPGSVWGYGVPYLMRSQQKVINSAWRMVLDNAGVSSGPQVVMKPGSVQPADKNPEITSRKLWYAQDDVDDVRTVFTTFEFASHQQELSAIIEMADRLSDQETAVPMLSQGQQGSAPETVGGMQILMQGANVMLRRLVKHFDDYVTKPHVRRYYTYLMEYSDREEIKGDFQVVALGASALVVRDIQNQAYTQMLTMGSDPTYAPFINQKKLFQKALEAMHIIPSDVMNTDAEIQAALERASQQQQPDPRVVAAQMRAQSDQQRTEAQKAMNSETNQVKQSIAAANNETTQHVAQMQLELDHNKLAVQQQQHTDTARVSLATVGIRERSAQDMQAREMELKSATGSGI